MPQRECLTPNPLQLEVFLKKERDRIAKPPGAEATWLGTESPTGLLSIRHCDFARRIVPATIGASRSEPGGFSLLAAWPCTYASHHRSPSCNTYPCQPRPLHVCMERGGGEARPLQPRSFNSWMHPPGITAESNHAMTGTSRNVIRQCGISHIY